MFAPRLPDTEQVELFLPGSSARLLSREVATSMRGRAANGLRGSMGRRGNPYDATAESS